MLTGTIKKYIDERGFGFIQPDSADTDVFFHVKETDPRLADELKAGLRVTFEYGQSRDGRPCAVDIRAAPVRFGEAA
jgi:cold shock protein